MKNIFNKLTSGPFKKIFLRACLITLGAVGIILGIGLIVSNQMINSIKVNVDYDEYQPVNSNHVPPKDDKKAKVKDKNVMIFGVDKDETRTDTILIAHFESKTGKISIMSIPRDTRVYWSELQQEKADELGKYSKEYSKITDMSSLGGIDNLRYFTIRSVEEMLDVKVDNYVVINTQVLREIVDGLGGIEVDVPRRMEYWDDYQDLHIDLQPGVQVLNGEQAEGLLRWRHNRDYSEQYALGDVGRIETQQLFLKAFADKLINEVSVSTVLEVATAVYSNMKMDMGFKEVKDYISYLPQIKVENISFYTMPGESRMIDGLSYYLVDEQELAILVDDIFYGIKNSTRKVETHKERESSPDVSYDTDYSSPVVEETEETSVNEENLTEEGEEGAILEEGLNEEGLNEQGLIQEGEGVTSELGTEEGLNEEGENLQNTQDEPAGNIALNQGEGTNTESITPGTNEGNSNPATNQGAEGNASPINQGAGGNASPTNQGTESGSSASNSQEAASSQGQSNENNITSSSPSESTNTTNTTNTANQNEGTGGVETATATF